MQKITVAIADQVGSTMNVVISSRVGESPSRSMRPTTTALVHSHVVENSNDQKLTRVFRRDPPSRELGESTRMPFMTIMVDSSFRQHDVISADIDITGTFNIFEQGPNRNDHDSHSAALSYIWCRTYLADTVHPAPSATQFTPHARFMYFHPLPRVGSFSCSGGGQIGGSAMGLHWTWPLSLVHRMLS